MLLDEQGRRHEDRHLHAVLHRLEGRAHRDLGLAVTDVAADQPVHRDLPLHVELDLFDGRELVRRLHIGEGVFELALPRGVRAERVPGGRGTGRVQPDQLAGDLADRLARPPLRLRPVRAAESVQGRCLTADIPGDLVKLVGGYIEAVGRLAAFARRVLDNHVLAGGAVYRAARHLDIAADPVLLVHDVVARAQPQRIDPAAAPGRKPPHVLRACPLPRQVALGEHRGPHARPDETVLDKPGRDIRHTGLRRLRRIGQVREPGTETAVAEQFREPLSRPMTLSDQHDPPAVGQPGPHVRKRTAGVAAVGFRGFRTDPATAHAGVAGGFGGAAEAAHRRPSARLVGAERSQRPPGRPS